MRAPVRSHYTKKTTENFFFGDHLFTQNKSLPSLGWSISVLWVFLKFHMHGGCTWWWQWWKKKKKQKPQLSSTVAHGKVCTRVRTLSVWVNDVYAVGLGTVLWWVTSLRDIGLTETNAHGVLVKNGPVPFALIQLAFKQCPKVEPKAMFTQLKWWGQIWFEFADSVAFSPSTYTWRGFMMYVIWLSHYRTIRRRSVHSEHALNLPWRLFG